MGAGRVTQGASRAVGAWGRLDGATAVLEGSWGLDLVCGGDDGKQNMMDWTEICTRKEGIRDKAIRIHHSYHHQRLDVVGFPLGEGAHLLSITDWEESSAGQRDADAAGASVGLVADAGKHESGLDALTHPTPACLLNLAREGLLHQLDLTQWATKLEKIASREPGHGLMSFFRRPLDLGGAFASLFSFLASVAASASPACRAPPCPADPLMHAPCRFLDDANFLPQSCCHLPASVRGRR
ncbi:hypothetical protein PR202_ga15444 [Eleusine coracana subsp. coracana]|uniref:Uncharacterized protein n=1 Tax=Eleusine coracana subsp. coracana TaxID=191504 RepID=A0AAV5CJQ1_ELECO|nr:hypothetical protein PR202_ga15444 [Eleusine coracana subsp. coracana]